MEFASLLFSALASPFGIRVVTSNPELLRQKLYAARRDDQTFSNLSILPSPANPSAELWIIKKA